MVLDCLVHAKAVLLLNLFALHEHRLTHVLPLQILDQDCLVFLLLILLTHKVELLKLLSSDVELRSHRLVLHQLGLTRALASTVDARLD